MLGLLACVEPVGFDGAIERFSFASQAVGDRFAVDVYRPRERLDPGLAVAFVLDGDQHAEPVARMAKEQGHELVVVGIGYLQGYDSVRRRRDYTPTVDPQFEQSGGAPAFFRFVAKELVPFLEERFLVSRRHRSLFGHSQGGMAGLFAALTQDAKEPLFEGVVAASPAIWWDRGVLLDLEEGRAATGDELTLRLWMSVGDMEPVTFIAYNDELVKRLRDRKYTGLELEYERLPDTVHNETWERSYEEGMLFLHGPQAND